MIHYLIVQILTCCKKNCGRFSLNLTLKPSQPASLYFLRLGEKISKHKESHSSTEKCYLKPAGRFD